MKWAVAQGYRSDNPAGDAISAALPRAGARTEHRRALPHAEVGAALKLVRASYAHRGLVLAFEFLVLTAARSGEVRAARWEAIDRDAAVWMVPAELTDAPREVCELALAHVNPDRVEAAYRRSDLFDRRRKLMADWVDYVGGDASP